MLWHFVICAAKEPHQHTVWNKMESGSYPNSVIRDVLISNDNPSVQGTQISSVVIFGKCSEPS